MLCIKPKKYEANSRRVLDSPSYYHQVTKAITNLWTLRYKKVAQSFLYPFLLVCAACRRVCYKIDSRNLLLENELILQLADTRDRHLDNIAIVQELLRLHECADACRRPRHDGCKSRDRGACRRHISHFLLRQNPDTRSNSRRRNRGPE